VDQPVDQGDDASRIREDLGPFGKRLVGGDDDGSFLISPRDHLEEEIRVPGVVGEIANLIDLCAARHKSIHVDQLVMWSRRPETPAGLGFRRPRLHITGAASEGLEPRKDGGVRPPHGERRVSVPYRAGLCHGRALGLEVDDGVAIGRLDAGVA